MDGCLFLHLRCIVVKATQVLQSCLVAELVFILVGDRVDGDPVSFITEQPLYDGIVTFIILPLFILRFYRLNEGLNVSLWIEKIFHCATQLKSSVDSSITSKDTPESLGK